MRKLAILPVLVLIFSCCILAQTQGVVPAVLSPANATSLNGAPVTPNLSCAGTNSLGQVVSGTGCSTGGGLVTPNFSGIPKFTNGNNTATLAVPGTDYLTPSTGLTSFNSRNGSITPASGDYSFSLISGQLTLGQLPLIPQNTVLGSVSSGSTAPTSLTAANLAAILTTTNYNATTATALAGTPTLCATGNAPTGILSNGNATGCAPVSGGGGIATPTFTGIAKATASSASLSQAVDGFDFLSGLEPELNWKAAGLVCNGTTDDGPAISAAINNTLATASTAVRILRLPSGTCRIATTIHVAAPASYPWSIVGVAPAPGVNNRAYDTRLQTATGTSPAFQFDYNKSATITSISLTSNVVTVTFSALPTANFILGQLVDITNVPTGANGVNFNGQYASTAVTSTTVQYSLTGVNDSSSGGTIASDWSNSEYDGTVSKVTLRNLVFENTGASTNIANYSTYCQAQYQPSSVAIQDWRNGGEVFDNVGFYGYDQPFFGVQADLMTWYSVSVRGAHSGIYLGPRSDQAHIYNAYYGCNDTAEVIDGAQGIVHVAPVVDSSGIGTTPAFDIVQSTLRTTADENFYSPWFEERSNAIDSWIRVGYNILAGTYQITGVNVQDPNLEANGGTAVNAIVSTYSADGIKVSRPTSPGGGLLATNYIWKMYGSFNPTKDAYEPAGQTGALGYADTSNAATPASIVLPQILAADPRFFTVTAADDNSGNHGATVDYNCGTITNAAVGGCNVRLGRNTNSSQNQYSVMQPGTSTVGVNLSVTAAGVSVVSVNNVPGSGFKGILFGNDGPTFNATSTTFSATVPTSFITLTANLSAFVLPSGGDGEQKTIAFCQNATGGWTVTPPSNVIGFFYTNNGQPSPAPNTCSWQTFRFNVGSIVGITNKWWADGPPSLGINQTFSTPACTTGSATSCAMEANGRNEGGRIDITTGSGSTANSTLASIAFSGTPNRQYLSCVVTPGNAATSSQMSSIYVAAPSSTGWAISVNSSSLASSTSLVFNYACMD